MASERQQAASRANSQLSHGPKTPEGKARSSQNALRHGLLAKTLLVPNESPENFQIRSTSRSTASSPPTAPAETALGPAEEPLNAEEPVTSDSLPNEPNPISGQSAGPVLTTEILPAQDHVAPPENEIAPKTEPAAPPAPAVTPVARTRITARYRSLETG